MDRHAAGIDRGYAGRRQNDHPLRTARAQLAQESRLARAGLAGQKYAGCRPFDETAGQFQFGILLFHFGIYRATDTGRNAPGGPKRRTAPNAYILSP